MSPGRRRLALAVAALAVAGSQAPAGTAGAAVRPSAYVLPSTQVYPEGVAFDERTGTYYVSSTADGTIFRGTLDQPTASVFLPGGTDGRTFVAGVNVADGLLFLAGGGTGKGFVYDASTGALVAALDFGGGFVNDVAVVDGVAYFTDSVKPYVYTAVPTAGGYAAGTPIPLAGTPFVYQPGFNANGIEASRDGRYLVAVQSNTGALYRITRATGDVVRIAVPEALTNGDGLVLRGRTLQVVRNADGLVTTVRLSGDLTRGVVVGSTADPSFHFPTTADIARGRLLVVNSQFERAPTGDPALPFTVSSVRVP